MSEPREDLQVVGWADCIWRPKEAESEFQRSLKELQRYIDAAEKLKEQRDREEASKWKRLGDMYRRNLLG